MDPFAGRAVFMYLAVLAYPTTLVVPTSLNVEIALHLARNTTSYMSLPCFGCLGIGGRDVGCFELEATPVLVEMSLHSDKWRVLDRDHNE